LEQRKLADNSICTEQEFPNKEIVMKTPLNFVLATGIAFSAFGLMAQARYAPGSYQLDPAHSKVGFEIPHLVVSTVEGRFTKFDGQIDLAEPFAKSKANVSIDLHSIDTGEDKRDEHLRSPDFFDVKKFPKMTFVSSEFTGTPEAFKLTGNLTLHGVTRKVTLDGKYLGTVVDGYGNQKAAFAAKGKINRKDFGLTWSNIVEAGPVVGDEVTIDLRLQAARPLKK
jgi:polyisoprenoid-binding protein YceI